MVPFLKAIIQIMYTIHREITQLNNVYEINMTDKQLHCWVFGFVALVIFVIVHWLFLYLSKKSILLISFIYTFTVATVLAFAIEIGQYQSKTGHMEFADILYGLYGFVVLFIIALMVFYGIKAVITLLRKQ